MIIGHSIKYVYGSRYISIPTTTIIFQTVPKASQKNKAPKLRIHSWRMLFLYDIDDRLLVWTKQCRLSSDNKPLPLSSLWLTIIINNKKERKRKLTAKWERSTSKHDHYLCLLLFIKTIRLIWNNIFNRILTIQSKIGETMSTEIGNSNKIRNSIATNFTLFQPWFIIQINNDKSAWITNRLVRFCPLFTS